MVESATWMPHAVPYHVEGIIRVRNDVNQPVLTLQAGLTLAFGQNTWLSVGEGEAGVLVVAGTTDDPVTLMSSQPSATPGSWVGQWLDGNTLAGTVVDHAAGRAAMTNSSSAKNDQADIFVGCEAAPTLSGNGTVVGVYESDC